jgi:hypothetical protein
MSRNVTNPVGEIDRPTARSPAAAAEGLDEGDRLDEFLEKGNRGTDADACRGPEIPGSHGGDLPKFGLGKTFAGIAKSGMNVVIRPFALDKLYRLTILHDDEIDFSTLQGISPITVVIEPGAASHQNLRLALILVEETFKHVAPFPELVDFVQNEQGDSGPLLAQNPVSLRTNIPTDPCRCMTVYDGRARQ